jgi:exopolyphosphatase/guanosine-5'-triphosphate,3'-diphosphate pyrophosphatase
MNGRKTKSAEIRKADQSLAAVRRLARAIDPEPAHAFQVCRIAETLFDRLKEVHHLDRNARRLLTAAALLHDVGHTVSYQGHHQHARDLILGYDLPGFSEVERAIVACVARYHRKAHPSPKHRVFSDLDADGQALVRRLAAILRIADGLDRAHDAAVRELRTEMAEAKLVIHVLMRQPSSTDIWGGRRKCGLFEEVFDLLVEIVEESDEKKA